MKYSEYSKNGIDNTTNNLAAFSRLNFLNLKTFVIISFYFQFIKIKLLPKVNQIFGQTWTFYLGSPPITDKIP